MKIKILWILAILTFFSSCTAQDIDDSFTDEKQLVLSGNRLTLNTIGSKAFTDLIYFENRWFLTYRDSDFHILGKNGKIKIFSSLDGISWDLGQEFLLSGVDLRDPKFSVNENSLTVYIHGSVYEQSKLVDFKDFISEWNKNGWSDIKQVLLDNKNLGTAKIRGNESWPWRVTWYGDVAYVFGYNLNGIFGLYTSKDGINFVNKGDYFQKIGGTPTEATIRIDANGNFYSLIRRNNGFAILLKSTNKGEIWETIAEIPISSFGGPNFLFYKNGLIMAGRENNKVVVCFFSLDNNKFSKLKTLASGGDCSYPGMVIKEDLLWISYYSGHETKSGSSIYLAKIKLEDLKTD